MNSFIHSGNRQEPDPILGWRGNRAHRRRLQSLARRAGSGSAHTQPHSFSGLMSLESRLLLSGDPLPGPQIVLEGLNSEIILSGDASPSATDGTALGSIVAQTTATRQFTVRNTGTGSLNITSLSLPDGYVLVESLSQTIAAGESDSFTIELDTQTLGFKSGQITILSDDADEGTFDFAISATVIQTTGPEISVRAAGASISIVNGDRTASLADGTDFGHVYVHSSAYRNFVIHNLGDKVLKISNLSIAAWAQITGPVPSSIAPGASAQFTVRVLTPPHGTLQASALTFTTNDPDESSFSFVISAHVVAVPVPELRLLGLENANFGDVPVGWGFNVVRHFTLQNNGSKPLHISDLTVTPGFIIEEGLSTSVLERDGVYSDRFTIRVDNSVLGPISGFVTLKTNDPVWGDITFPVSANVTPVPLSQVEVYGNGQIIWNNDDTPRFEDHTEFGSLRRGGGDAQLRIKEFKVTNTSERVLNLSNLSVPEGFVIWQDLPASLPPRTTGTFSIAVADLANPFILDPGVYEGMVSFQTDDPELGTYSFAIHRVHTGPDEIAELVVRGNDQIIEDGDASPSVADFTSFGTAEQGSDGVVHTYFLRNLSEKSFQIFEPTVPEGFEIVKRPYDVLGGMKQDAFSIRMLTGTPGVKSGDVTFRIYELLRGQAVETIFNFAIQGEVTGTAAGVDDTVVSIVAVESTAYETTLSPGIVRISRTGPVSKALVVPIVHAGNATFGAGASKDYWTAIGDYTLTVDGFTINNRVTIPAGASFVDVLVTPLNDGKPDPFESAIIQLGGGSGYFLTDDPDQRAATVTIEDGLPVISIEAATPEPPVSLQSLDQSFDQPFARMFAAFSFASEPEPATDSTAAETNAGDAPDNAVFRVNRTGNKSGDVVVKLSISGTARLGTDYVLMINGEVTTQKTVTIPSGDSYVDLIIVPINDAIVEKTETIAITVLANKSAYSLAQDKADRAAAITLADNEATVSVEAIDAQASEPGETVNPGTFRISRTGSTGEALTVAFTLTGSAKRGVDYVNLGSKITIPAGASFVDVDIDPISDARTETPELVTLKLAKSTAYTLDPTAALGTVTIEDAAQIAGVDLLAAALTHPAKTFKLSGINSDLKISTTIINQGGAAAVAGAQVRVVLSRDRVIDAGDLAIGTMSASLPAIGAKPVTLSGRFNIDSLALDESALGSYFIILVVDSDDLVSEAFENNNTFASLWSNVTITA